MRVLVYHPWGRFDAQCGASRVALAHMEYLRTIGADVHCVMQEIPAWGVNADEAERTIRIQCDPVAPHRYGDEFCQLLYATERAANARTFRELAKERWDAFFTTDVTAAPLAHAFNRETLKILAVGDSYARRAATTTYTTPALRDTEQRFAFARVEAELFHIFDRVLFDNSRDASTAIAHGVTHASHVQFWLPQLPHDTENANGADTHDIAICGGARSGELADLEAFYRHVYLPHLRACGVRLTVAGTLAERFAANDLRVQKVADTHSAIARARLVIAPAHEASGPCVSVWDSLAAGRAIVTTPHGARGIENAELAMRICDMRNAPEQTATVIRALLASREQLEIVEKQARQAHQSHTRERFFAALDHVWQLPARVLRTFAEATR